MKHATSLPLFLLLILLSAPTFAFKAAPSVTILEQGYPDAIFYFVNFADEPETVTVMFGANEIPGMVETDPNDATLRIFRPDVFMALGAYDVEVTLGSLVVNQVVTVVDRPDDRGFTYTASPIFLEFLNSSVCCDGTCHSESEWRPIVEFEVDSNAPLRIEARLLVDDQVDATQSYSLSGTTGFSLASEGTSPENICVELIATDLADDEVVQMESQCFTAAEFGEPGEPQTVPDGFMACANNQSSGDKDSAGCCATQRANTPLPTLLLLVLIGLVGRRRLSRC